MDICLVCLNVIITCEIEQRCKLFEMSDPQRGDRKLVQLQRLSEQSYIILTSIFHSFSFCSCLKKVNFFREFSVFSFGKAILANLEGV